MTQNPIQGGAYYRDADGVLHRLEDGEQQLDPNTRLFTPPKRFTTAPKASAPEPVVTTTIKK